MIHNHQHMHQVTFCWPYSIRQAALFKCQVEQVHPHPPRGDFLAYSYLLFEVRKERVTCKAKNHLNAELQAEYTVTAFPVVIRSCILICTFASCLL